MSSLIFTAHACWWPKKKIRKQQVGSGMRGDKIRTIRVRDNRVKDHRLGTQTTYDEYVRGDFSRLLNI